MEMTCFEDRENGFLCFTYLTFTALGRRYIQVFKV